MNHFTEKRGLRILPVLVLLLLVPVTRVTGTGWPDQSTADQPDDNPFGEHLKKAKAAYEAKDYKLARQESQQALKLKNDSPDANLLLALVDRNLRKPDDALKYAKKAIQYRQNYSDAHYLVALLLYEKGDLKQSTDEIDTAMSLGYAFTNAFVLKGTLQLLNNKRRAALDSYKEALRLAGPDNPDMAQVKERVNALEVTMEFAEHRNNADYKLPVPLNAPVPNYTQDARDNRVQGKVQAAVFVSEEGKVSSVVLLTALGHGLDGEAIRAAKQIKFTPAMKAGKPVPFWVAVIVEFNLR